MAWIRSFDFVLPAAGGIFEAAIRYLSMLMHCMYCVYLDVPS